MKTGSRALLGAGLGVALGCGFGCLLGAVAVRQEAPPPGTRFWTYPAVCGPLGLVFGVIQAVQPGWVKWLDLLNLFP